MQQPQITEEAEQTFKGTVHFKIKKTKNKVFLWATSILIVLDIGSRHVGDLFNTKELDGPGFVLIEVPK